MSAGVLYDLTIDKRGNTGVKKPLLLQSNSDVFDSFEKAKSQWNFEDSNQLPSITQSTQHIWKYQTGIRSDWMLELTTDASAVFNVGNYAGCVAIEEIELTTSSQSIIKYTGDQLYEYIKFYNQYHGNDTCVLTKNMIDAGTGNIQSTSLFIPLLLPGQNCVMSKPSQPINLNLLKSPFEIRVKLRAGNLVSKTNGIPFGYPRLRWKEWVMESDQAPLYNKFSMVDFNYAPPLLCPTITQSTNFTISQIQNVFDTNSIKECMGLWLHLATDANVNTNFDRYNQQVIEQLKFSIGNQDVYNHTSVQQSKMLLLNEMGVTPYDTTSNIGPLYFIPFKKQDMENSYVNKGTPGVSLSKVQSSITINTSGSTGTYWLFLTSVNKCTFVIENGSAKMVY
jgi:hypothetical protein